MAVHVNIRRDRREEQERMWNGRPALTEPATSKLRTNGNPRKPNDGYERGRAAEERFLSVCKNFQMRGRFPSGLMQIRSGTVKDDQNGIDMVAEVLVESEIKLVPIQIKSSLHGKEMFQTQSRYRHIICIVVMPSLSDDDIFNETIEQVDFVWEMMRLARAAY